MSLVTVVTFFTLPSLFQHQLAPAWPEKGWLEFRNVVLAYRDGLPNALDGVSLVVRPGEKVGIVGRTGSGKSTLFLALFRMVELNQGQILLDELDISTVGLAQLRYAEYNHSERVYYFHQGCTVH